MENNIAFSITLLQAYVTTHMKASSKKKRIIKKNHFHLEYFD